VLPGCTDLNQSQCLRGDDAISVYHGVDVSSMRGESNDAAHRRLLPGNHPWNWSVTMTRDTNVSWAGRPKGLVDGGFADAREVA
jgi:hypothetical protein